MGRVWEGYGKGMEWVGEGLGMGGRRTQKTFNGRRMNFFFFEYVDSYNCF